MSVLVMRIVHMDMRVFHRLMHARAGKPLGQMEPEADRHQQSAGNERQAEGLAEEYDGDRPRR